jgi:hypothetical protein
VDLKSLTDKAKDMFTKRGGADAAKEDLNEVKDIIGKDESLADKARDSAEALKDPGAPGAGPAPTTTPTEPAAAETPPPADAPPTGGPAQP